MTFHRELEILGNRSLYLSLQMLDLSTIPYTAAASTAYVRMQEMPRMLHQGNRENLA